MSSPACRSGFRRTAGPPHRSTRTVAPFAADAKEHDDQGLSDILGIILFKAGQRRAQVLAFVQEHGAWIDWQAPQAMDDAALA